MERTISIEVGKGSQAHNSRKFKASNVDAERTQNNVCYLMKISAGYITNSLMML